MLFKATKVVLPEEPTNILKFSDYSLTMKYDYCAYADFETVLKQTEEIKTNKTKTTHLHEPCGYSLIIVDHKGDVVFKSLYRGKDCATKFLDVLANVSKKIFLKLKHIEPMIPLTDEQESEFDKATNCYLCDKIFEDDQIKTHDHDHRSGMYLYKKIYLKYC
jgi:hypothetical protein